MRITLHARVGVFETLVRRLVCKLTRHFFADTAIAYRLRVTEGGRWNGTERVVEEMRDVRVFGELRVVSSRPEAIDS